MPVAGSRWRGGELCRLVCRNLLLGDINESVIK